MALSDDGSPGPELPDPGSDVEERIREVAREWDHRDEDIGRLLDRVTNRLVDHANHELLQTLTTISTRLELAARRTPDDGAQLDPDTLDELLSAVERATDITHAYLDRRQVARSLIRLHRSPVDLGAKVDRLLEVESIPADTEQVHVHTEPVEVEADEEKLSCVLDFLVSTYWRMASPDGRMAVEVRSIPDGARCFVGVDPCPVGRKQLVERLVEPLSIEAYEIDVPYARAIIERHGGLVYVASRDQGFLGYEFELPAEGSE